MSSIPALYDQIVNESSAIHREGQPGVNVTPDDVMIESWTLGGSGTAVQKDGRTTDNQGGTLSAAVLIAWVEGGKTTELSIAAQGFASEGDSGALVYTDLLSGTNYAVGLLFGLCRKGDLAVYIPMWLVLETAEEKLNGGEGNRNSTC